MTDPGRIDPVIDVERERARTPGTQHGTHLNAAGASLRTTEVIDAVRAHLEREDVVGGYEAALEAASALEQVRVDVASLVRATPEQIGFTDSASRAWATAFYSVPLDEGDVVLVDRATYVSSALMLLRAVERRGITVEVVGDDSHGQLDVEALDSALEQHGPRAKLVAATHVPTSNGLINPATDIGSVTGRHGVPFLLDGCQSIGQLDVDVTAIGCDFYSAAGRKFLRGPRGTGFLFARDPASLDPFVIDGAGATWSGPEEWTPQPDARRIEMFEYDVAARLGLGVAARQAVELGTENIEKHLAVTAAGLRERLAELPGVRVLDRGERLGGIVTFAVADRDAGELTAQLRTEQALRLWWSERTSAQWSLPVDSAVRASPHVYTSDEDLDRLIAALAALSR
jgi:selenocysteine lyase/cysteine desulfurase